MLLPSRTLIILVLLSFSLVSKAFAEEDPCVDIPKGEQLKIATYHLRTPSGTFEVRITLPDLNKAPCHISMSQSAHYSGWQTYNLREHDQRIEVTFTPIIDGELASEPSQRMTIKQAYISRNPTKTRFGKVTSVNNLMPERIEFLGSSEPVVGFELAGITARCGDKGCGGSFLLEPANFLGRRTVSLKEKQGAPPRTNAEINLREVGLKFISESIEMYN